MDPTLAAMRRDYEAEGLSEADALADPIEQFQRWFDDARRAELHEPNAMTLATVDAAGQPAARVVLLKIADRRGLAFFTNRDSRKGKELLGNPKAALVFWWGPLQRQVRFEGIIEEVEAAERAHRERFEQQGVARPPFWGGHRLVPAVVEFWHRRESRLHDRLRYTRTPDGWRIERLAP